MLANFTVFMFFFVLFIFEKIHKVLSRFADNTSREIIFFNYFVYFPGKTIVDKI